MHGIGRGFDSCHLHQFIGTQVNPFLEKIGILAATAAMSGLLIPVITQNMAHTRLLEQRQFETELARENEIIKAQVKLIENLSDLLWEYQLLAIEVTYYQPHEDQTNYIAAVADYDAKAGDLLGKIRSEISKSIRLTSLDTYDQLIEMYYGELIELDVNLRMLIEGASNDWHRLNQYAVFELSVKVDNLINDLAMQTNLKNIDELTQAVQDVIDKVGDIL